MARQALQCLADAMSAEQWQAAQARFEVWRAGHERHLALRAAEREAQRAAKVAAGQAAWLEGRRAAWRKARDGDG